MGRILFFVLIGAVIYLSWRMMRVRAIRRDPEEIADKGRASQSKAIGGKMRQCEACGVFVPETEGVVKEGRFYCCREHAKAGAKVHEN